MSWYYHLVSDSNGDWHELLEVSTRQEFLEYTGTGVITGICWHYRLPDPFGDAFTVPMLTCYRYLKLWRGGELFGYAAEELKPTDVPLFFRRKHDAMIRHAATETLKYLRSLEE